MLSTTPSATSGAHGKVDGKTPGSSKRINDMLSDAYKLKTASSVGTPAKQADHAVTPLPPSAAPATPAAAGEKKAEPESAAKARRRPARDATQDALARRHGMARDDVTQTERPTARYSDLGGIESCLQEVRELIDVIIIILL